MGTPLSPFSAVLVSITCHSTGSSSLPHSQVCWHSQGKASLGLLTTPTSVMQGAHGAARAPPRQELLKERGKTSTHISCSKLSAGQSWEGFFQHVLVTSPWCPQAAVCHHSASADPNTDWASSVSSKALSYLNGSNLCPRVLERQQFFSKQQQHFSFTPWQCSVDLLKKE